MARRLTKAEFGSAWPLSVDEGVVRCLEVGGGAVVFEADGKTYALNGVAKTAARAHGYAFLPTETIWLEDPKLLEMAKVIAASENRPLGEVVEAMGPRRRLTSVQYLIAVLRFVARSRVDPTSA